MGKQANVVKTRVCILCKRETFTDSNGLKEHFRLCVRATRLGLVLPGIIVKPEVKLV